MMMIDAPERFCNQLSWDMPCPPDGSSYPSPIEPLLIFLVAFAVITIGLVLYEVFVGRKRRRRLTLQNARQAAQRISAALHPLAQGQITPAICKSILRDLLFIIDYNLFEITRSCGRQSRDPGLEESLQVISLEAMRLRGPIARAYLLLSFNRFASKGQELTLKAAARYNFVLTPVLRQIQQRHSSPGEFIPILEIEMPNGCHN